MALVTPSTAPAVAASFEQTFGVSPSTITSTTTITAADAAAAVVTDSEKDNQDKREGEGERGQRYYLLTKSEGYSFYNRLVAAGDLAGEM